jgi:hypothetical protein
MCLTHAGRRARLIGSGLRFHAADTAIPRLPGRALNGHGSVACEIVSELQLDGHGPSHSYAMSGAATFWYYMMCIAFGGGYFAKVSYKKALWEVVSVVQSAPGEYAEAMSRALYGPAARPVPR